MDFLQLNVKMDKPGLEGAEHFYIIPENGQIEIYFNGPNGIEKLTGDINHTWNLYSGGEVSLFTPKKSELIEKGLVKLSD